MFCQSTVFGLWSVTSAHTHPLAMQMNWIGKQWVWFEWKDSCDFHFVPLPLGQVGGFHSAALTDSRKQGSVFRNEEFYDPTVTCPQLQLLGGQWARCSDSQWQQELVNGGPAGQSFPRERSQHLLQWPHQWQPDLCGPGHRSVDHPHR